MGLDMYLAVDGEMPVEKLIETVDAAGLLQHWYSGEPKCIRDDQYPVVAYWRKANAIHSWFVRTQANGVDECQVIPVSRQALMDLVHICHSVLEAPSDDKLEEWAEDAGLETQSGFFFGSTDYDDWYREDLKETIKQVQQILDAPGLDAVRFIYVASW